MKPNIYNSSCEEMLRYITDCNLATVCKMAMASRRTKSEFDRQISIGQLAHDWLVEHNCSLKGSRSEEIHDNFNDSVADWAKSFISK